MLDNQEDLDLSKPQRQNLLGIVVYLLKYFRAMITILITLVAIASTKPAFWAIVGMAIIPVLIILGVLAYYQYRNFTFHVSDDELIIHNGVFFKDKIEIRIDRIQSIQVTENLVQRILKLVALKVDTAGSKGNELEIPALDKKYAEALKALLYSKKKALTDGEIGEENLSVERDVEVHTEDVVEEKLVHLSVWDLLLVGLTENHLRTGFIAIAFVFGTLSQYQEIIEEYWDDSVDNYASQAINAGITVMLFFLVAFVVMSILISLVRTILRFFDLKATLKLDAVEISTGLLKRNNFRVPIKKVQFVQWETNPLRRAVGFESAKIKPTNSVGETTNQQSIEIPALKPTQSELLATGVFPGYHQPEAFLEGRAMAYARLIVIVSSFLILPVVSGLFIGYGYVSLFLIAVIPLLGFFGYRYGKTIRIFYDKEFLIIKKGRFFTERIVLPSYKLQSIELKENIFLKRRGLCHLQFYTAAGSRSVRYLSTAEAKTLYDFLLYCIESNEESWM